MQTRALIRGPATQIAPTRSSNHTRLVPKSQWPWVSEALDGRISARKGRFICVGSREGRVAAAVTGILSAGDEEEEDSVVFEVSEEEELVDRSIWSQIVEIVKFSGPATGLWICGPLMGLIDTAVIGQSSSTELAALGPGTVLCDNMSYVFMFLSIATSNLVATTLARKDEKEVQHQISTLLCVGLGCGLLMLLFTKFFGSWALTANTYVQIRGFAWPAVLIGWVAQSASLGMKDSWVPLKALVVASTVSVTGNVVLCSRLGYGIAGAAWATMASQVRTDAAIRCQDSIQRMQVFKVDIRVSRESGIFTANKLINTVIRKTLPK